MIKVAINGFGRIGRLAFRRIIDACPDIEITAINDLGGLETLAHLLKYDSSYGSFGSEIEVKKDTLIVTSAEQKQEIRVFSESDPLNLPWRKLNVDIVLECTGVFRYLEDAFKHIKAGAKKVIISAPAKSESIPTYLLGVNEAKYEAGTDNIISMGSCTTNCVAPVAKVLDESFGIEKGFITTVHSYTNDQRILDLVHKDIRRARAAGLNIIPTTTGAAESVEKCLPQLAGKLKGIALRVPTATVSIIDFTVVLKKKATAAEINNALRKAAGKKEMEGILKVEDKPLVSSDYKGSSFSSIVDSLLTVASGNTVKIFAWYDNEWGYASRLAEMADYIGKKLN